MLNVNPNVFIRHESGLKGNNVFIYVGNTNTSFEANTEVLRIIEYIKQGNSITDMAEKLCSDYPGSDKEEIIEGIERTTQFLIENQVVGEK